VCSLVRALVHVRACPCTTARDERGGWVGPPPPRLLALYLPPPAVVAA
jgi:hypothetical protein